MSYSINEQHINSVIALETSKRYEYFIQRVADWEELWSLKDESGWVSSANNEGLMSIPFWPHPKFAELCASDSWEGNNPSPIALSDFMSKWLPGMNHDGLSVAVFPLPEGKAVEINPLELLEQLEMACQQYE